MKTVKDYGDWMSKEIVKTYLLQLDYVFVDYDTNSLDFIGMDRLGNKKIGIEVKAYTQDESRLMKHFFIKRNSYVMSSMPVIMIYINYLERTGCFEIIYGKLPNKLIPLSTDNLKSEIKKILLPKKSPIRKRVQ